ncbi:putative leucine-rich repeat-containing protein DDB_G0290503 [Drosophila tropicalis]|uniref:putative leucine-rich repeat-containing protein DDB_G0290503 n=1 Tax=Drosophila tropicalis TaxID=46794 RepID=UPI0035ABB138
MDLVKEDPKQIPRDLDKTPPVVKDLKVEYQEHAEVQDISEETLDAEKKSNRTSMVNEVKILPLKEDEGVNIEPKRTTLANREGISKRDLSIETIEEIKKRKKEARLLKKQESSVPLNDKVEQEEEQIPRDLDKTTSVVKNLNVKHQEDTEVKVIAEETLESKRTAGVNNIEDIGVRDISIATIEEIKYRKKEARLLKEQLDQERKERRLEEMLKRDFEYKEMKVLNKQERESEKINRRNESSILCENYDQLLLDAVEDEISASETPSDSEQSDDHIRLSFAETIFAALEDMPVLSELSLSVEDDEIAKPSQSIISNNYEDTGRFVDPLTGESLHSSSETYIESFTGEVEEYIGDDGESNFTLSLDDLPMDDTPTPTPTPRLPKDELEYDPNQLNFNLSQTVLRDYSLQSDNLDAVQVSDQIVSDFLQTLLKYVVSEADTAVSKALFTQRLDIVKLHQELQKVVEQHLVEKYRNNALNLKTVKYYRRNEMLRHIEEHSFSFEIKDRHRYFEALLKLDFIRKRAAETKTQSAYLLASVLMELHSAENMSMHLDKRLSDLIYKTIVTKDSELLRKVVEREMRLFNNKRNEVSDLRFHLITKNHTLARYDEKIGRLATINEDVNMDTFLLVQNQCTSLQKKLEEKSWSLHSLHSQFYNELHLLAHIRERTVDLCGQLQMVKAAYKAKYQYKLELREKILHLKLQRDKTRKQVRHVSFQGGLLQYHSLMLDFDDTVEKVSKLQANVQTQRNIMQQLEAKLEALSTLRSTQ